MKQSDTWRVRIDKVYFWQNGMVMAFDDKGEQIPKAQGFIFARPTIDYLKNWSDSKTKFYYGKWNEGTTIECDFSWWFIRKNGA